MFLQRLFNGSDHDNGRHFRQNARLYNCAFSMTSFNAGEDPRLKGQHGPFQIQGQLVHFLGPLLPDADRPPAFAQLWIYDRLTDAARDRNRALATAVRCTRFSDLRPGIVGELTEWFELHNRFSQQFMSATEQLFANEARGTPAELLLGPGIDLVAVEGTDKHHYNLPREGEQVAALLIDPTVNDLDHGTFREVILQLRHPVNGSGLKRIDPSHAGYLPMQYPLFFPYGDDGWHWGCRRLDGLRLSACMYHAYRVHIRRREFSPWHYGGRLWQQYLVDAWGIIEQAKLEWIRHNQTTIRAELYSGLTDALAAADGDVLVANNTGQRVILPSNVVGTPWYMQQLFQDAMAICQFYGPPSLFITFTANPAWDEVTRELRPSETWEDRPDIVSRVFNILRAEMVDELCKKKLFRVAPGRFFTIKYQKRGLPHMYLVLFLEERERFLDAAHIDEMVSAELPDPREDLELYKLVKKHMIHAPCGPVYNSRAPCCDKRSDSNMIYCTKRFPKAEQYETQPIEEGYPLYRRRADPRGAYRIKAKNNDMVRIDNTWVVPYNPYLLKRFRSHINVEVCRGVDVIKYITKYIYKGPDRASMRSKVADEVDLYLDARYVGASEAVWRLLRFPLHQEWPPVTALHVHEPARHLVYYNSNAGMRELEDCIDGGKSMLMGFFEYNAHAANPANAALALNRYLYAKMPQFFTWDKADRIWRPRTRNQFAISRMYHCSPNAGERFYIQLLLTVCVGPVSFEDLRTHDGILYPTFKAACNARGLLKDDHEWHHAFEESVGSAIGAQLRTLFVVALTSGTLNDPPCLWEEFKCRICSDLEHYEIRRMDNPPDIEDRHIDYGLFIIARMLAEHGERETLDRYGLPLWTAAWGRLEPQMDVLVPFIPPVDLARRVDALIPSLNIDQRRHFDTVSAAVADRSGEYFYLQGAGGTGKTYLYTALYYHLRAQGKTVLCIASSGIASLLLPYGRTSHSTFGIPLALHEESTCAVTLRSTQARVLAGVDLIIWDEAPMQH